MNYSSQPIDERKLDMSWRSEAGCRGLPVDYFFPHRGEPVSPRIREVCTNCPVRNDCLEYALYHERHGVWGGMTENQRDQIRRERNIICRTPESIYYGDTSRQKREIEERRPKLRSSGSKL